MNCCEWHTLSFAFIIIPRVIKSTPSNRNNSFVSSFLFLRIYTPTRDQRSWVLYINIKNISIPCCTVYTHKIITQNVWMLITMTFSLHFYHSDRSLFLLQIFYILNETQIGWLCHFWFDFRHFVSSISNSCLIVCVHPVMPKKIGINFDIKSPINSIFAFFLVSFFLNKFH